ncbi:MAG: hypothetical protein H6666_10715 [Ardenticatenaceae bacterium]|nr:hypothetical protein [Ardenticatenaceae bacterium]
MKRINQLTILIILLPLVWLVACTPGETGPEAARETEIASGPQPPQVSPVVPFGEPEVRDLQPTIEVVSNCGGVTQPVVKHPSITVGTAHSVEWEVGGSVGVGFQIGSDLTPAKVDLNAALEGSVARDLTNSIQQGNAWDLPAEPGYIMEYTIMWRELWQRGYVDATFLDPEPEILRIDVKYRTGIQSEIVGQNATRCDSGAGTSIASVTPPASTPLVTSIPPTPTSVVEMTRAPSRYCPMIVIEGTVGGLPIAQTRTWAELAAQGTTREPQSANVNDTCSRDNDNRVQVWVGYWSNDPAYLDYRRTMTSEQAIQLVQQNPNQPVIIVPWGE